ncbi:MAG TPA: hypothetical protein VFR66_03450, partial [Burkholderiales bacterium]|nr:hypothetical protein [Burkholderiales bacterium]
MVKVPSVYATMQRNFAFNRETAEACKELIKEGVQTAKDPFYRKVIESQKKYDEQIVPFRLSWFPPY